ncbi:MAG: choice-of-anchor L domain-containing protein [Saprospiraceae bacterium]|nr:choice-of-anchor L domain-containing protein [Saprospiraceae bacterium]
MLSLPSPLFVALLSLTFSSHVIAQQHPVVQWKAANMREALTLPRGTSTVTICGLVPGNLYKLMAVPKEQGQSGAFEIAPAPALSLGTSSFAFIRERNNEVSFAAPASCVDIQINTMDETPNGFTSLYLSIANETDKDPSVAFKKGPENADQAVLQVQGGISPEALVKDVLVGGGCFQISNVNFIGDNEQIGKFSNGFTNIGFESGVILTTGRIQNAIGPNNSNGLGGANFGDSSSDPDLESLTTGSVNDKSVLEFDFVPTQNQVFFEFAFASEEYCEYVNSQFNDVFGFFISGPGIVGTKNIALIPSTNIPVTINNVNHLVNNNLYTHNTPVTGNNCGILPAFGPAVLELEYDGFTKKMIAIANVIPCQQYHIKLAIGDVGDYIFDSAVFLRANSFDAGGTVLASPAYPGGFGSAYENCDAGNIRFTRGSSNINLPLVINFTVAGSATPGVDYVPITSPVIIPAGQTELLVPVTIIPDLLPEGPENILLLIPNACSCSQGTVEFVINDRPTMTLDAQDQVLCAGETATLQATISGGLPGYSYLWSTGETSASINPTTTGAYTLTVTDACGGSASTAFEMVFTDCSCNAETFLKTLEAPGGLSGDLVHGFAIYDSGDGNLYVTGSKHDSALIVKMDPAGIVIWTRTFDVKPNRHDRISEMIIDTDGMIVGCGQSGENESDVTGFVFRYNPNTNTMQWINTYGLEFPQVYGLMELPNGNYLVYDHPNTPIFDLRLLEITRSDGAIDMGSQLSQKLRLGNPSNLNSATIFDGKIYGVGQFANGNGFNTVRHALTRIDLNTGNVDWVRLSHVAPGQNARLTGMDLLIEDEHIISTGFGNETSANFTQNQIFLQKNDLNGDLIWVKRFNIPEAVTASVEELVSVPDGFILYARGRIVPSDLYLLKTDKNGELQWSKKIDFGLSDFVEALSHFQSQIMVRGDRLFFIGTTHTPGTSYEALVVKTTLEGTLDGNCDFIQPVFVETSDVTNPVNLAVDLLKVPFNEQISTMVLAPTSTHLLVESHCEVFVNEQIDLSFCVGESVTIDSVVYVQDTTFSIDIPGSGGCDTLRTYTITSLPFQTRSESISFCPGSSVTLGGQSYNQSGTVLDTIPSVTSGCDTIVTYQLTLLPQPTRLETITFCPGETITLGGNAYTQPGTVVLDLASSTGGCDTIATYTLQFGTPAPSNVNITCPGAITIGQPGGSGGAVVDYPQPTASSDCICPGIALNMTSGLPSGSNFPAGVTAVCFTAKDSCGQTKSCCFNVTIQEDDACDTKVAGCVKYELLTITEDAGKNRTYRIRVTNNCSNKLLYTAIQIPDGMEAMEPDNFTVYTAPSGNTYRVRNPNHSPQHSIRYSSISDSIHNGESDIFKYTLPAQANVTFINVVSRLETYLYLSAHLNTFYCPIGVTLTGDQPNEERNEDLADFTRLSNSAGLILFPNPTSGELFADFSWWQGELLHIQVMDSRGQRVQQLELLAGNDVQSLDLPVELPGGLYFLEVLTERGEKHTGRFVIQR